MNAKRIDAEATDHHTQEITSVVVRTGIGKDTIAATDDCSCRDFPDPCADPPTYTLFNFCYSPRKYYLRALFSVISVYLHAARNAAPD